MRRIYLTIVLFSFAAITSNGQKFDDDSNWYKEIGRGDDYHTRFDFTRAYSREDVARAAKMYQVIEATAPIDEWEGVYSTYIALGEAELRWRTNEGFVFYSVYHTLADLEYGGVVNGETFVRLRWEKKGIRKGRSALFADRLLKVKVGNRHYLVPESRLKDFAERSVGRETSDIDGWDWWFKIDENDASAEGLPNFPKQYSHLLVSPIETTIKRVGQRRIIPSEYTTKEVNNDDIFVSITLAHGADRGIKKGMDFFVPGLGEWIEITRVNARNSIGRIRRDFDLNMHEQCWDSANGGGEPLPCKPITAGLSAITRRKDYF